jgi:tRNA dimethylallyltransferase
MNPIRAYFLIGQTASGKGAAGFVLAEAIGAEIVSLDSMKIYRGMDIGTATPSAERRAKVPHHMLDVTDPHEYFSTALYTEAAEKVAGEVAGRGAVPLFVGGTGLYLRAMTEGLFDGPEADEEFRAAIRREADELGSAHVHARLAQIDPAAGKRIHPNDIRRIERALEVYEKTGTPISELQKQFGSTNETYDATIVGLRRDKANLHDRINRRVDRMMKLGLLDEVRRLLDSPRALGREASQAVGYKELIAHLNGECTPDKAVELIKIHTRQLAKAQMTGFKRNTRIQWLNIPPNETPEQTATRIQKLF